ncbi:unnamed protein product, partial [Didymodactylos carnosus]
NRPEAEKFWLTTWITKYLTKFLGAHEKGEKRVGWQEYIWSWLGAFLGILFVALLHYRVLTRHALQFLIGSFGASAVLIYGAPTSPLAQPRNLIGGHVLSALVGCIVRVILVKHERSVACALAVAFAIVVMHDTVRFQRNHSISIH